MRRRRFGFIGRRRRFSTGLGKLDMFLLHFGKFADPMFFAGANNNH
ncbi:MAG: hypothetical protein QOI96_2055 [Verrucomicrobiota bacterium]